MPSFPWRSLWRYQITEQGTGSVRIRLYYRDIARFRFPLPPLPEQRKIAEILSSVDEATQATQAVIDQTRRVKEGLLQELLTKGIGQDGKPHTSFKPSPIGEIPESWEVKRFKDLANEVKSSFINGPFGSDLLTSELNEISGVPVLYIRDLVTGDYKRSKQVYVSKEKATQLDAFRVDPGDVLIPKVGDPPGVATIYPENEPAGIVTQDVIRIRVSKNVEAGWVRAILNSELGRSSVSRIAIKGTRKRVSLGDFKELKVPLPQQEEQRRIVSILSNTDDSIRSEEDKLQYLFSVKAVLLQDLLTGKKRVRLDQPAGATP